MVKRVVLVVVVLVLAISAYVSYNHYDSRRAGVSGEVFSNDPQPGKARVDSVSRTATESAATPDKKTSDSDADAIVYPSTVTAQQPTAPGEAKSAASSATPATDVQVTQTGQPAQDANLAGDTISPNPPNGMMFAGKGRYQLYRQGNITWRVNTVTGQNCILFATDEEWKKPRVYRAGCGSSR
jgi:hypothetical protein